MSKLEAQCFDLILERKGEEGLSWDDLAEVINKENGTNVYGDQVREFCQRKVVPFGGWLTDAIEHALKIPRRHPKSKISFKGGGGE